ncbi:MAG: hypothetical protein K0S41_2294 [Anaerocolumna sp.]|nr:hypothetical protein [Anaerocolumna sp.]
MKKTKVLFKVLLGVIVLLLVFVIINFIPTWNLKTKGMRRLEGNWVDVYYESEIAAAKDIFQLADTRAKDLADRLGFTEKQNINIYIYDNQSTMQMKKYGFIGPLLGLDWYIGDNIGTNVILTSPANPGKVHNYDSIKNAVLHEMVHGYASILNPKIQLWLTEGLALYLSNGEVLNSKYKNSMHLPSYTDIQTRNPIKFSNMGGYSLAHTYIEYICVTYGWDKVLELIKSENYEKVFGISGEEMYSGWINYFENYDKYIELSTINI